MRGVFPSFLYALESILEVWPRIFFPSYYEDLRFIIYAFFFNEDLRDLSHNYFFEFVGFDEWIGLWNLMRILENY